MALDPRDYDYARLRQIKWHDCHHCDGRGCEVCEDKGGWFMTLEKRERLEREHPGWPFGIERPKEGDEV